MIKTLLPSLYRPTAPSRLLVGVFMSTLTAFACQQQPKESAPYTATVSKITEYTPETYPDDPDLRPGFSDPTYGRTFSHSGIEFVAEQPDYSKFTIKINPNNDKSDLIIIPGVCLDEWIPTVPTYLKTDKDLGDIALYNQQFNRVQVKFQRESNEFQVVGSNLESKMITRIDLAKNCLQMPFWEMVAFTKNSDNEDVPIYHGWFNFPGDLHTKLLIRKGWSPEESPQITELLTSWMKVEPQKPLQLGNLRTIEDETMIPLEIFNSEPYPAPKYSERLKKFNNIIHPKSLIISDFLNNDTKFARFVPPGKYSKRTATDTQLGRFKSIVPKAKVRTIQSKNPDNSLRPEIELTYFDANSNITKLLFGGFDINKFKKLSNANANKGMTMPFGIANHNFNQSYKDLTNPEHSATNNPCYAMVLDDENRWLNSHNIGLDALLFYFDEKDDAKLHIWLLSFERHAFVGHYTLTNDWSKFQKKQ